MKSFCDIVKYFKIPKLCDIISLFRNKPEINNTVELPVCSLQKSQKFELLRVHTPSHKDGVCLSDCGMTYFCNRCGKIDNCFWIKKLEFNEFDKSKQTILIIDDNPGMVSFLRDDIENILEEMNLLNEYNIIDFSSKFAAYYFTATLEHYDDLNITKAIIDITLGGAVQSLNGNIKLNGIDVFEKIYELNKDVKFLFYTGNQLNPYIHSNKTLIDKFDKIYSQFTGKGTGKIFDFVLYKTALNIDERREYFKNVLF